MTDLERAVLDIEGRFWKHAGAKEDTIRRELGLTPTRYYQVLARLADDPEALAHAPVTVNRIRRIVGAHRR